MLALRSAGVRAACIGGVLAAMATSACADERAGGAAVQSPDLGSISSPNSQSTSVAASIDIPATTNGVAAAASTVPTRAQLVRLSRSGACGEAFFWAESASRDVAVTVSVNAQSRSADSSTTISIAIPDPTVDVEILTGNDLSENFCTDILLDSSFPVSTQAAASGTGEITLDPALPEGTACGSTNGTLRLTGLVGKDGTTFAPIDITSSSIACYAG